MDGGLAGVFKTPKTILGFFAIVLAILFIGAIWIVAILAADPNLHCLILPILLFLAAVLLLVLIGIFVTAWKDPTILMLGQVTGEVYLQYRQLKLGDSFQGESIEDITVRGRPIATEAIQLPPSGEEE